MVDRHTREDIKPGTVLKNLFFGWEIKVREVIDADTVVIEDPHGVRPTHLAYLLSANYELQQARTSPWRSSR